MRAAAFIANPLVAALPVSAAVAKDAVQPNIPPPPAPAFAPSLLAGANAGADEQKKVKETQDATNEAAKQQRSGLSEGRASTLLTGPSGLLDKAPTARRILLGA